MSVARALLTVTVAIVTSGSSIVAAQTQAYPPDGYSPLLFDPSDTKYIFRLNLCIAIPHCYPKH